MYHYLLELVSSWQKCSLDPFLCNFHFDCTQYTTVSPMRREQFCKRLINVVKASKFNIDRPLTSMVSKTALPNILEIVPKNCIFSKDWWEVWIGKIALRTKTKCPQQCGVISRECFSLKIKISVRRNVRLDIDERFLQLLKILSDYFFRRTNEMRMKYLIKKM